MKKISMRNYRKHYVLHLLPATGKNHELVYNSTADESIQWNQWMRSLIKSLVNDPLIAKNLVLRADKLKKQGGPVASLQVVELPLSQAELFAPLVYLDLNYIVNKEVQLFIGGIDVTHMVATSDKLTGLLTRFLKELYAAHEDYYFGTVKDPFMEELFEEDDVDMVIDEDSKFKVQVDRALMDYLLALNSRLRINA